MASIELTFTQREASLQDREWRVVWLLSAPSRNSSCSGIRTFSWRRPSVRRQFEESSPLPARVQSRRFLARAGDIFGVTAAVLMDALGSQFQHAVRQGC